MITFETAKLAKDKGFNIRCKFMYDRNNEIQHTPDIKKVMLEGGGIKELKTPPQVFAPTQPLLQKWLREVHNINVESNYLPNIQKYRCLYVPMAKVIPNKEKYAFRSKYYGTDNFDTYEEALEEGLQKALELI